MVRKHLMNGEQRTATTSAEAIAEMVHLRDIYSAICLAIKRIPYMLTVIRDKYSLLCKSTHININYLKNVLHVKTTTSTHFK